ncbi:AI-2E family transporter [Desulfurella amilsii]|uniref:AI-2E family transporter n=1 Tax=Desulfurella amilsii TaxID=1562698 RepID=UPI000A32171D|nr:AI-2E family transporter [Desulfurella amilsii]
MKLNFLNLSLITILLLSAVVIAPFWKPILWGIVLAIIFTPLKTYVQKIIKGELLASVIVLVFMIILILLPFVFLVTVSSSQINSIANFTKKAILEYANFNLPFLGSIKQYTANLNVQILDFLTKNAFSVFSYTYKTITDLIFALLVAFYLIKDKDKFLDYITSFIKDKQTFEKLKDTIRLSLKATLIGGFIIALIQGFLCALGFLIVGIGGFFIWMALGAVISFVPVVGTALLWAPASVYFLLTGSYLKGIFLLVWGGIFVGSVDNYVRPLLIGSYMSIHPLLLFFSIMGGIVFFGLIGIFIGPIIISLADAVLNVYKKEKNS